MTDDSSEQHTHLRMIDETDIRILSLLQDNARVPNAEIARQLGMAPSAILERIRKLEERGIIRGYPAEVDPKALGFGLMAYVFVRADDRGGGLDTGEALAAIPEVLEVHHIAGEDCFLAKVRTADTEALGALLRERVGQIASVRSTRTTIVLGTLKDDTRLPLPREMEVANA